MFSGVGTASSSLYIACGQKDVSKYELQKSLEKASMQNKTLIISVLNRAYSEENGLLGLFLRSLKQGKDTETLVKHVLFVAVDQVAFDRCKLLKLLADVLKLGYNFIYTDLDVMWLKNPNSKLTPNGEDMLISCDMYNGKPFDEINPIDAGFYFVISSNKTTALFDEWYASRNNSEAVNQNDILNKMKNNGAFRKLSMKVKFLDTHYFGSFCQGSRDIEEVITVNANCCSNVKAKLADLTTVLEVLKNDTTVASWPKHKACGQS